MASESNTYQIKAADKCEALDVSAGAASAEQIKGWLNDTNAPAIVRAADAYASAASHGRPRPGSRCSRRPRR
ncbi:hypothetical protein [Nonomuraea dietziae]|uniref:hypothetical protein n=1 Tax=Nonomuraea dietziae TaxID=65515 RepID=UPI0031DFD5F8